MQEAHYSVRADLSEEQVDELIEAMPQSWHALCTNNAEAWNKLRLQAKGGTYHMTRVRALQGDIKCRRIMVTFALICLKNRLTC